MNSRITSSSKRRLASSLLTWWEENKESYPFRETSDPYKVLVSEMLLRKTRGDQLAAVYHEFFEKFPTPSSVVSSSLEEIADIIKPLGIVSRANHILEICKIICEQRDGEVPSNGEELNALPGVGRYIANVVLTMAFRNPKPMVDSNVKRVLSRVLGIEPGPPKGTSEELWSAYGKILPEDAYRQFHFAIIDLAHKLCVLKNPLCSRCPLNILCHYCASRGNDIARNDSQVV